MSALAHNKPAAETLDLENIFGGLSTVETFCEALDGFIGDLRHAIHAAGAQEICAVRLNDVDIMAFEIKHRIAEMRDGFNEFVDAAEPENLRTTRKAK